MSEFYPESNSDTEQEEILVKCKCKCKKTSCKSCFPQEYKSVPDSE